MIYCDVNHDIKYKKNFVDFSVSRHLIRATFFIFFRFATFNTRDIFRFCFSRHLIRATFSPKVAILFSRHLVRATYSTFKVGKLIYDNIKNIGPKLFDLKTASQVHSINTKYSTAGNYQINYRRTLSYGAKALKNEATKLWPSLPDTLKNSTSRNVFKINYKKFILNTYPS
jgi:hypothetical protein